MTSLPSPGYGPSSKTQKALAEGIRFALIAAPLPATARNDYAGEILGIIHPTNRASQNVIRKLGFAYWKQAPVQGDLRNLYRLHV
jgi:hypothetical protein